MFVLQSNAIFGQNHSFWQCDWLMPKTIKIDVKQLFNSFITVSYKAFTLSEKSIIKFFNATLPHIKKYYEGLFFYYP